MYDRTYLFDSAIEGKSKRRANQFASSSTEAPVCHRWVLESRQLARELPTSADRKCGPPGTPTYSLRLTV